MSPDILRQGASLIQVDSPPSPVFTTTLILPSLPQSGREYKEGSTKLKANQCLIQHPQNSIPFSLPAPVRSVWHWPSSWPGAAFAVSLWNKPTARWIFPRPILPTPEPVNTCAVGASPTECALNRAIQPTTRETISL